MAIDTSGGALWCGEQQQQQLQRRGSISTYKFRLREERKKVIRITSAKYRSIEDHENGLRRFVLIR